MSEWHELVIQGAERTLRAFVVGFSAGRGETARILYGGDIELETASIGERLKELFAAGSHHAVFAPAPFVAALADAVNARGKEVSLRIESRRVVTGASFSFRVEVFTPELAREIRALLVESLPPGARVDGFSEQQESHPEARGPEPFAPLHSCEYRASGRVIGAFVAVIDVWKRAHEHECVETGSLSIEGNPLE